MASVVVRLHWNALLRMRERGATEQEVVDTVLRGERVAARAGRVAFRRRIASPGEWRGRPFRTKHVVVHAVRDGDGWLAITILVDYVRRRERRR